MKLTKNQNIYYEIKDARTVLLKVNGLPVEEIYEDGKIKILNISSVFSISIGTAISHDLNTIPTDYVVRKIVGLNDSLFAGSYSLLCSELNKSYTYLVPTLYVRKKFDFNSLMLDVYFMNSFVSKSLSELILCYRYSNCDLYGELELTLTSHPQYIRVYHLNGFDYFVFSLKDFSSDVLKFKDGKYSKFSQLLKNNIVSMFNLTSKNRTYQILYRSKELLNEFEREYGMKITDDIDLDAKPNEQEFIEENTPMF